MATTQEYKCPCCGGAVNFDSTLQKMKCPYCDSEFDVASLVNNSDNITNSDVNENMEWDTKAGSDWTEDEQTGLRTYVCQSCAGEIVADKNTAATSCPFCNNPVVMKEQVSGMLKPDYVIPFATTKEQALESLKKHYKGKFLLPKAFKDQNHLDEIKGIYVPFWLFDADADADCRYKMTKVHTWSDARYRYTETEYYGAKRVGNMTLEHVPVDGSSTMPDDLMESIEPFDFSKAVGFQMPYLSGYFADKYDVDADASIQRANQRIKKSAEDVLKDTVKGYATVFTESSSVALKHGKAKYALYPVWILNTTYQDKNYLFAMNGQTGKFVGNLPCDKLKTILTFLGSSVVGTIISLLVMLFL